MSLPPAPAPPCSPPAPLSCVPHGNAVSVSPISSRSPVVIPSSSVSSSESPLLLPLHPLLASSLSPWPSTQRPPLSSSLLTCDLWPHLPRSVSAVILPHAVVFLQTVSASPRGHPAASPFLPPFLAFPPFLQAVAAACPAPRAPSRTWPSILPAGTKMLEIRRAGLVRLGWWRVDPPCSKIHSRPHVVGISHPLFLHLPQQ